MDDATTQHVVNIVSEAAGLAAVQLCHHGKDTAFAMLDTPTDPELGVVLVTFDKALLARLKEVCAEHGVLLGVGRGTDEA